MARPSARRLALAAAAALAVALLPSGAHANGDPASDVLFNQNVFFPFQTTVSVDSQRRLKAVVADANRVGYRVKVAIILAPYDLGTAFDLFGKPQGYARFLGTELRAYYRYRGRTLVAMPAGFGLYAPSGVAGNETQALERVPPGRGRDGVTDSTVSAVERLAAAAGHHVSAPKAHKSTTTRDRLILLVIVVVAVAAVLVLPWPRRLLAGRRRPR